MPNVPLLRNEGLSAAVECTAYTFVEFVINEEDEFTIPSRTV